MEGNKILGRYNLNSHEIYTKHCQVGVSQEKRPIIMTVNAT